MEKILPAVFNSQRALHGTTGAGAGYSVRDGQRRLHDHTRWDINADSREGRIPKRTCFWGRWQGCSRPERSRTEILSWWWNRFQLVDQLLRRQKNQYPKRCEYRQRGRIYFTDPMFGMRRHGPEEADSELAYTRIYKFANGTLSLLNKELATPNGIAITNDQTTLIVSDTAADQLFSFDLTNFTSKPIATTLLTKLNRLKDGGEGHCRDGLKTAANGSIWATGKGGIHVLNADGTFRSGFPLPEHISNLAFGGNNNEYILVTLGSKFFTITLG